MTELFANYRALLAKVDQLCQRIEADFAAQLACQAGCSGCCRHISLSWVEAAALAVALADLPAAQRHMLRKQAQTARPYGPCPLLVDHRCALYAARPIICRTHGLPVMAGDGERQAVSVCPRNFAGVETIAGSAVIDLERLNSLLAATDRLFVKQALGTVPDQDRLTVAEALLLDIDTEGDQP
jgi:Fe-S-cluster containining protein